MTLKLDFPMECAIKELELTHKAFLEETDLRRRQRLGKELQTTLTRLGGYAHCRCHDHTCPYWRVEYCGCHSGLMCKQLDFMVETYREGESDTISSDFVKFQIALTEQDRVRQPDETFIGYKVRLAAKVRDTAGFVRRLRDEGLTTYSYQSWNDATPEDRATHFKTFIAEVRASSTRGMSQVVGCFLCGRTFKKEENLLAHVDRLRFLDDMTHSVAKIVTPNSVAEVRPSPPYQLPEIPPSPEAESNLEPETIGQFPRADGESLGAAYRAHFKGYLFENLYSDARGCELCGNIYSNETVALAHINLTHSLGPSSGRLVLVEPEEGAEPESEEPEDMGPYDEDREPES